MKTIPVWNHKKFIWEKILLDDEDFDRVIKYKWFLDTNGGVVSNRTNIVDRKILSRYILGITDPSIEVDHKNRNKLDNRKNNFRICTKHQNRFNQGPQIGKIYKGVKYIKKYKNYVARIRYCNELKHLGTFKTPEEAARRYDKAAKFYFKEFAYLNFPEE